MNRLAIAWLAVLAAACQGPATKAPSPCTPANTAEGAVCGFYTRFLELHPTGLPTPAQQAALAPWLSARLEQRLDAARAVQAEFRVQNPGEKPPLVDGCLFASLFEGPSSFTVGAPTRVGVEARVPVQFRYDATTQWLDVVVVAREGDAYVIDDVEFGGAGPFNPPGRLSELLEHAGE